jgi:hypothetical protein
MPATSSLTIESVSADGCVTARQQQNRDAQARKRARGRLGLVTRRIVLEREWLDTLEERGYLDPDNRGEAEPEIEAVRAFLTDQLG